MVPPQYENILDFKITKKIEKKTKMSENLGHFLPF